MAKIRVNLAMLSISWDGGNYLYWQWQKYRQLRSDIQTLSCNLLLKSLECNQFPIRFSLYMDYETVLSDPKSNHPWKRLPIMKLKSRLYYFHVELHFGPLLDPVFLFQGVLSYLILKIISNLCDYYSRFYWNDTIQLIRVRCTGTEHRWQYKSK